MGFPLAIVGCRDPAQPREPVDAGPDVSIREAVLRSTVCGEDVGCQLVRWLSNNAPDPASSRTLVTVRRELDVAKVPTGGALLETWLLTEDDAGPRRLRLLASTMDSGAPPSADFADPSHVRYVERRHVAAETSRDPPGGSRKRVTYDIGLAPLSVERKTVVNEDADEEVEQTFYYNGQIGATCVGPRCGHQAVNIPKVVVQDADVFARDGWKRTALGACGAVFTDGPHGLVPELTRAPGRTFKVLASGSALYIEVHDEALRNSSARARELDIALDRSEGTPMGELGVHMFTDGRVTGGYLTPEGPNRNRPHVERVVVSPAVQRFRIPDVSTDSDMVLDLRYESAEEAAISIVSMPDKICFMQDGSLQFRSLVAPPEDPNGPLIH